MISSSLNKLKIFRNSKYFFVNNFSTQKKDVSCFELDLFNNQEDQTRFLDQANLTYDSENDLLRSVPSAQVEVLDNGIKAITFSCKYKSTFAPHGLGHTIFERTNDSNIFSTIQQSLNPIILHDNDSILIENMYYWLIYQFSQQLQQQTTVSHTPELIISQIRNPGNQPTFIYYLLKDKKVFHSNLLPSLQYFNPKKVCYFYSTMNDSTFNEGPLIYITKPNDPQLPITFNSIHNYENFMTQSIPELTSNELSTLGKYILKANFKDQKYVTKKIGFFKIYYAEKRILERFQTYGNQFNKILPPSSASLESDARLYEENKQLCQALHCIQENLPIFPDKIKNWMKNIEEKVPLVPFQPPMSRLIFDNLLFHYCCEQITPQQLKDILIKLITQSVNHIDPFPLLLQVYIARYFIQETTLWNTWKCQQILDKYVTFSEMIDGMIYFPLEKTNMSLDMYFKKKNKFYGIITGSRPHLRSTMTGPLATLLKEIEYPNDLKSIGNIHLIYCRLYESSKWKFKFNETKDVKFYKIETFHNVKYYDFVDDDSKPIQLLERNSITMTFDNQTLDLNEKILYFGEKPRDHKSINKPED